MHTRDQSRNLPSGFVNAISPAPDKYVGHMVPETRR